MSFILLKIIVWKIQPFVSIWHPEDLLIICFTLARDPPVLDRGEEYIWLGLLQVAPLNYCFTLGCFPLISLMPCHALSPSLFLSCPTKCSFFLAPSMSFSFSPSLLTLSLWLYCSGVLRLDWWNILRPFVSMSYPMYSNNTVVIRGKKTTHAGKEIYEKSMEIQ